MAKKPKQKRTKRYNPHKTQTVKLQWVNDPALAVGFTPDMLANPVFHDPEKIKPVEVDEAELTDIEQFMPGIHANLVVWCAPHTVFYLSKRKREYLSVLLDNSRLYAKMLYNVCGWSKERIEQWRTPYETYVQDAYKDAIEKESA